MQAALNRNDKCVHTLSKHTSLHIDAQDREGDTALLLVLERLVQEEVTASIETIKYSLRCTYCLLAAGIDPSILNFFGTSSFSWAFSWGGWGSQQMLKLLFKNAKLPSSLADDMCAGLVGVWDYCLFRRLDSTVGFTSPR